MQEEADVFDQIEGPWSCGTFVDLLLVLGLMRVDTLENTEAPEKQKIRKEKSVLI